MSAIFYIRALLFLGIFKLALTSALFACMREGAEGG